MNSPDRATGGDGGSSASPKKKSTQILRKAGERRFDWMSRHPSGSLGVVITAMRNTGMIALIKLSAWGLSGSSSLLAEAVHSLTDMWNQLMLLLGARVSERHVDRMHPYGWGKAPFMFALASAGGVMVAGCGWNVFHGVSNLMQQGAGAHSLEYTTLAFSVLACSAAFDSWTLHKAAQVIRANASKAGQTFGEYLRFSGDPFTVGVFAEDTASVLGSAAAATCLGLAIWTGQAFYDDVGSIAVGALLGVSAGFLIKKNMGLLMGQSIPANVVRSMVDVLQRHPTVAKVHDVKVEFVSTRDFRFKADVRWDGRALASAVMRRTLSQRDEEGVLAAWNKRGGGEMEFREFLCEFGNEVVQYQGEVVDQLEAALRKVHPMAVYIDLETHFEPSLPSSFFDPPKKKK